MLGAARLGSWARCISYRAGIVSEHSGQWIRHCTKRTMPLPVVDLTISDSESDGPPLVVPAPKAAAAAAAAAVPVAAAAQRDHAADPDQATQRKRIMEHAQALAKRRRTATERPDTSPAADALASAATVAPPAADAPPAPVTGSNSLLAQLAREREARLRQQGIGSSTPATSAAAGGSGGKPTKDSAAPGAASKPPKGGGSSGGGGGSPKTQPGRGRRLDGQPVDALQKQPLTLMTYNVWFQESVAVEARMAAIGELVARHNPTLICFQEVTPYILSLFASSDWWGDYINSPTPMHSPYFTMLLVARKNAAGTPCAGGGFRNKAFTNSCMGRGLLQVELPPTFLGAPLLVATSHLESPCPPDGMFTKERKEQAVQGLQWLEEADNVLWAGDMNWTDSRDGELPLSTGWVDVWQQLQPGSPGYTYHTAANPMLTSRWPGSRLDRVLAKLTDWRPTAITLLGTEALPGVTYTYTRKGSSPKELPVLPSDHFGLLVTLEPVP